MRDSLSRTMPMRHNFTSRRNMLLYGFLGILCFVRTIENAPLTETNESTRLESAGTLSSGLQSKKGQNEEVGNPSEIAYQAWLLIDGHPDSQSSGSLDSASLLRRIKPKSIFVAPNLTSCADGYQDDKMRRCVKDVNIDPQAHKGFLVQRLQALFGQKSHASSSSLSSSSSSVASGPFQLNIPLIMSAPTKPPREKIKFQPESPEKMTSTTDSSKIIIDDSSIKHNTDNNDQDAIVTVYELNEDESTFFLGNKSSGHTQETDKNPSKRPDLLVPVAQFVDEKNTDTSDVIDYKIPGDLEKTHNLTTLVGGTIHEGNEGTYEDTPTRVKDNVKETNISPTLVLLLSPTKVPSLTVPSSDLIVAHNSSLAQVIIKTENVTGNATKEIIRVSVPHDIVSSSSSKIHSDNEDSTTDSRILEDFTSAEEETTESTESYYEENYEESTENEDEILKHSEAGMTVTLPPLHAERVTVKSSATISDDKEPTGSEISSEVSINGDFVRETTLVDFNVKTPDSTISSINDNIGKFGDTTKLEDTKNFNEDSRNDRLDDTIINTEDRFDDSYVKKFSYDESSLKKMPIVVFPSRKIEHELEETIRNSATSTEKSDSVETMIAASTNEAGTFVSREQPKFDLPAYSSSKKRAGQPFRFETTTKIPHKGFSTLSNVEGVYDYEPSDYPRRNQYGNPVDDEVPVIRTIDEQKYRPDNDEEEQNFFASQQQDYVRFPSYDRHGRPNYVRFPSEEANSIHPNDYKDRRPYNRYQQQQNYVRSSQTTKNNSGQDIHQKQSYWWLPPGWKIDKQQQQEYQQRSRSSSSTDRSRTPMLLRFWTRMPLVRDPSLNYQRPTYPTVGARNLESARRINYYREMSSHDFNRAFARKSLTPAIGG